MAGRLVDNIIVFQVDGGKTIEVCMPAKLVDGVMRAWREVSRKHRLTADQVTGISLVWGPSVLEQRFSDVTFPGARMLVLAPRPAPDGWEAASEVVERILDKAVEWLGEETEQEAVERVVEDLRSSAVRGVLLPVLHSESLRGRSALSDLVQSVELIPGRISVTLAWTEKTPRQTFAMTHLTRAHFKDLAEFEQKIYESLDSVGEGLRSETGITRDGHVMTLVRRLDGLPVDGALCLGDFHEWISEETGWQEFDVKLTCPDSLLLAETGSPGADQLLREVLEPDCGHGHNRNLLPTLVRVTADGMEVVAERAVSP